MEQSIQQYFRTINRADWQRAYRVERLLVKRIPGWDPEDCIIAHPRTGNPVRLETPGLNTKSSHAANWAMARRDISPSQTGTVLIAQNNLREPEDEISKLFGEWYPQSKAQKAADALFRARSYRPWISA